MEAQLTRWAACLRNRVPYQSLKPAAVWDEQLEREIQVANVPDVLKAGLHLWNDSLDHSHALSQHVDTPWGSYWHGIMHRMEGDFGNAKYWFRQAGRHAFHGKLHKAGAVLAEEAWPKCHGDSAGLLRQIAESTDWNPFAFVDAVQVSLFERDAEAVRALERMQRMEITELLEDTYKRCYGGTLFESL